MPEKNNTVPRLSGVQPLSWQGSLKLLSPRVFKIKTPKGHGTGFHIGTFGINNQLCAVATALHVIEDANDWSEPIKLIHADTKKEILLKEGQGRVIFAYKESDLAIIVFPTVSDLVLPQEPLEHLNSASHLLPGVEIAWCGFPGLASEKLCFFHGFVSCHLEKEISYLVDGVAISGVSGGPAFYIDKTKNLPLIAGAITAYIPNLATKEILPGVSMVSCIPHEYENTIKFLQNLSQVNKEAEKVIEATKPTSAPSQDKKDPA